MTYINLSLKMLSVTALFYINRDLKKKTNTSAKLLAKDFFIFFTSEVRKGTKRNNVRGYT